MPKARGDKYFRLQEYLQSSGQNTVTLTFEEIEKIIGFRLPNSAHDYIER